MKIGKLEKEIANAKSAAEMNQINIMNQRGENMGFLTGSAAQQSRLDTARLNALTGMYDVKLQDLQRKEAEKQQFISTYGADTNQRPKGMSKKEFSKAIQSGGFSELLTEDFRQKQLATARANQSLAGGSGTLTEKAGAIISEAQNSLIASRGADGFVDPNVYLKYRADYAAKTGSVTGFDDQFGAMLSLEEQNRLGISLLTPTQKEAQLTSAPDPEKTNAMLTLLDNAVTSAEGHADASGKTGIFSSTKRWLMGADDYTNLTAETNTIRASLLTLATDPSIKKFFGPQMSNADVQLMTSAGTMLNPELQTPEKLKQSLLQARDLITRARASVKAGTEKDKMSGSTGNGNNWQVNNGTLPSGNKFTITQK
jgi:hypothetical protein